MRSACARRAKPCRPRRGRGTRMATRATARCAWSRWKAARTISWTAPCCRRPTSSARPTCARCWRASASCGADRGCCASRPARSSPSMPTSTTIGSAVCACTSPWSRNPACASTAAASRCTWRRARHGSSTTGACTASRMRAVRHASTSSQTRRAAQRSGSSPRAARCPVPRPASCPSSRAGKPSRGPSAPRRLA